LQQRLQHRASGYPHNGAAMRALPDRPTAPDSIIDQLAIME
jgi:hypothetical protein